MPHRKAPDCGLTRTVIERWASPIRNVTGYLDSGRLFTSAASDGPELPDLVLHRGSAAVSEYNDPDPIPGMYPTLLPVGTESFDIPERVCALSFAKQTGHYLDLAGRSFKYDHPTPHGPFTNSLHCSAVAVWVCCVKTDHSKVERPSFIALQ